MQKLLEVTIDDQGNLDIQSDNEQILDENVNLNDLKKAKFFIDKLLAVMIDRMWKERNTGISKIVRLLSMAEIYACAEPYAQIEELWSTMMFSYIPRTEKYADSLKQKYGYDPSSKQKPFTVGGASCFGPVSPMPFMSKGMN